MFKSRCVAFLLATSFLYGSTIPSTIQAAENPVSAFSQEVGVVIRLKDPQKTLKKAGDLAMKVDRKFGLQVQLGMPALGQMISNPSLKGVDKNADWWVAVFPVQDGDPGVVFAIPASDPKALQEAVTGNYQFQTFEKWVIYTEHEPTAKSIKDQLGKKTGSIAERINKSSSATLQEGDLSVFVNVPQILKIYRGPFQDVIDEVDRTLDQLANLELPPEANGGMDFKAVAKMYGAGFHALAQSVRDSEAWAGGVVLSADGVTLNEYAQFTPDSKTLKALSGHQPTSLANLEKLPAQGLMYGGIEMDWGAVTQWGLKLSVEMYAKNDTEKQNQLKKLMEEYSKIKFGEAAMMFGLGDVKQGAIRGSVFVESPDGKILKELARKYSTLIADYKFGGVSMKMTHEPDAETYGDIKADILRMKYEVDPKTDPQQIQKKMFEALYGPQGMMTRTLFLENGMAQTVGGGKADVKALLEARTGKNTVGKDAAFQVTRKNLLPKANLIGMFDWPGTMAGMMDTMRKSADVPIPLDEDDLKKLKGQPSYIGFSLAVEKEGLKTKSYVPLGQMQRIADFVRIVEDAERNAF